MTSADAQLARIEDAITRLVQDAPALDADRIAALVADLRDLAPPLALSIARVLELVAERRIDAGIALPALAMACATLAGGIRGTYSQRELEAARNEIETLLPVANAPPRITAPDVPLSRLKR